MRKSFYRVLNVAVIAAMLGVLLALSTANAQLTTLPFPMPAPTLKGSGIWIAPITIPPVKKVKPIEIKIQDPSKKIYHIDGKCYKKSKYVSGSTKPDDDLVKISCT